VTVTEHGKERIHERCGIKLKSAERLAKIAYEKGLTHSETNGALNGYINSLYLYNCTANNIRMYGNQIYIFCNDTLVTVYDTPKRFQNTVNKLMRKRREKIG